MQSSLSAAVFKVSALRFASVLVLRRFAAVASLLKGTRAHRPPLCGHWYCCQFRGPYPQRLPAAASVFVGSAVPGPRGGVVAFKRARGRSSGGPQDDLLDKDASHPDKWEDTSYLNSKSPTTCSSSHQTPALTATVDNHLDNLRWQPSVNNLTVKAFAIGSVHSSSLSNTKECYKWHKYAFVCEADEGKNVGEINNNNNRATTKDTFDRS